VQLLSRYVQIKSIIVRLFIVFIYIYQQIPLGFPDSQQERKTWFQTALGDFMKTKMDVKIRDVDVVNNVKHFLCLCCLFD